MATKNPKRVKKQRSTKFQGIPQAYVESIPKEYRYVLDKMLDFDHDGVQRDLGEIADAMDEWEGKIAEELRLTNVETQRIKDKHPRRLDLQT